MCGICGFVNFRQRIPEGGKAVLERMNNELSHRGPDGQHCIIQENVAFGFSRLSIIGLSNGMQPIYNEDESLILICNGEIFNYIEIRQGLLNRGHRFKTASDVEVILHLYEEQGMRCVDALNGQFAFALYDKKIKTLFCARDHLGIIPFFYTVADGNFIFGSEIKAILKHPAVSAEIDPVGLDQIFTFAGLISPRTMFKGIKSLENGHFLKVSDHGKIDDHEYWDLIYPASETSVNSEKYYEDKITELLENSVRLRLRADVPLGLYLSGGLDSSMIAMLMKRQLPTGNHDAFSIDFADSHFSEGTYQRMVANQAGVKLNQKVFYFDDISERLKQVVFQCECPVKETYNTASLALSESVRKKGIKVILSGEGADEMFAGYVGYRFDKMRQSGLLSTSCSPQERQLRERLWGDHNFFYERSYLDFESIKKQLYAERLKENFDDINCLNHAIVRKDRLQGLSFINKRSYLDYKTRLVDHLISDHGDRMSMANSVEVRYPFLDKNLVSFSTLVPEALKIKDFTEKYILKKIGQKLVPKEVTEREKFGFVAPGSPYLLKNNIEYINDLLSYDLIKRQDFFDPAEIERLKKQYMKPNFSINAPFEDDFLITVITFGILHQTFIK